MNHLEFMPSNFHDPKDKYTEGLDHLSTYIDGQDELNLDKLEDTFYELATIEELHRCLSFLQPSEQEMIKLIYDKGMTYVEAADALHMPLGSFSCQLRRSIARLRNFWRDRDAA